MPVAPHHLTAAGPRGADPPAGIPAPRGALALYLAGNLRTAGGSPRYPTFTPPGGLAGTWDSPGGDLDGDGLPDLAEGGAPGAGGADGGSPSGVFFSRLFLGNAPNYAVVRDAPGASVGLDASAQGINTVAGTAPFVGCYATSDVTGDLAFIDFANKNSGGAGGASSSSDGASPGGGGGAGDSAAGVDVVGDPRMLVAGNWRPEDDGSYQGATGLWSCLPSAFSGGSRRRSEPLRSHLLRSLGGGHKRWRPAFAYSGWLFVAARGRPPPSTAPPTTGRRSRTSCCRGGRFRRTRSPPATSRSSPLAAGGRGRSTRWPSRRCRFPRSRSKRRRPQ